MMEAFDGVYVIEADVDDWGFPPKGWSFSGIPVFFALRSDGLPTGQVIDGNAWGENIPANMAPPLKSFFESIRR
jgi:hypothetical protein